MTSLLLQVAVVASLVGPSDPGVRYDGAGGQIDVAAPALGAADIGVDGTLDELAWDQAALLDGFTQFKPVEGTAASQRTEVRVFVDAEAIYFGIRAFDDQPEEIRATLAERDSYTFTDDYIRIVLDTFDDRRRAYVFTVNPLGVQHDGLWNESGASTGRRGRGNPGGPIDDSPDFLWESDGELTDWGYQAEIRVPYKSLRFPDAAEQAWGLQVERKIQRNGFESSWAPITGNVSNRLAQSGRLTGLRDLDTGLFMELNPVLTGSRSGALDGDDRFVRGDPTGDFGLNATYGVTSNLTLDATYNPDFSQVEADAGQIQVNERFALFFPEKRPFFLEGTEIFGMSKQLVYTRTIANPIAGGKLTGKVGGVNVGYLGAIDEPFEGGSASSYVNLLRVRGDVGSSSTVGAVYTDRTVDGDDFNRVAGADARLQLGGRNTLSVMGARSYTSALGALETGNLVSARFERAGRVFSANAELEDTDAGFSAGSGFFQRIGEAQLTSRVSYTWFGAPGAVLEEVNPSVDLRGHWDHDDFWSGRGLEEGQVQVGGRVGFRDNITLFGNVTRGLFSFAPEAYEGLFVEEQPGVLSPFRPDQDLFDGLTSWTLGLWVNKWERARGNVMYTRGDTPIFDPGHGVAIAPARREWLNAHLNLYPTRALVMQLSATASRLVRAHDDLEHSTAIIPRLRAQYQFSRSFFLRGIFEYASQSSEAPLDPGTGLALFACNDSGCSERVRSVGHGFGMEGLLSYEPSPGTVVFLGYSRRMEDTARLRFRDVRPTADGLFVKMSYRFRM